MQSTESLSLSALIMWTNQCLLGRVRLVRPQCRLNDEGTHLSSVRGPPTSTELSRHVSECEETSTRTLQLYVNEAGFLFMDWDYMRYEIRGGRIRLMHRDKSH